MKQATYIGKAVSTNSDRREYQHPTTQSTPSQTNTTHFPPPKEKMAQESYSIYGVYFPTNRPTQNMRPSNRLNPFIIFMLHRRNVDLGGGGEKAKKQINCR